MHKKEYTHTQACLQVHFFFVVNSMDRFLKFPFNLIFMKSKPGIRH